MPKVYVNARPSFLLFVAAAVMTAGCATSARSTLFPATQSLESGRVQSAGAVVTTIYSFGSQERDGESPEAGLVDLNGTLYGSTASGGAYKSGRVCGRDGGCGTLFSVTPSGTETVIYNFRPGGRQGANPQAALVVFKGELYGTTSYGGSNECFGGYGCGTVFSLTTTGAEKVLHRFNGSDGESPVSKLLSAGGTFYGTAEAGGASAYGTVFSVTPAGTYRVLHSFAGGNDGEYPSAGLVNVNGIFYGTTSAGGKYGYGIVFSITPSGGEKIVHAFNGSDGKFPEAALTNVNGTLYGTATEGGHANGVVFSLKTNGDEIVLHRFAGGNDGALPLANLLNVNGTLFGTTQGGGAMGCGSSGCGTVFSITTAGVEKVLYRFTGGVDDGAGPQAGLVNVNGTLYGTTVAGGANRFGAVYSVTGF